MNSNKESKFNNFIVQGGILAIAGILVRMLGLCKRIPLTYIIGDIGNSYYSSAYEMYSIVYTISAYGIPLSVSKLVAARVSKGQYRNADKIFKCSMIFATISGLFASSMVFIFADSLSRLSHEPMSYLALRALAPTLFIVAIMGVFRGYFQGIGSMVPTACSQLIEQVVVIIVSLSCAYFFSIKGEKVGLLRQNPNFKYAYGAFGATIGYLVGSIAALTFFIFLYKAYRKKLNKQIYRDPSHVIEDTTEVFKTLILTIVPVVISSTVNNISNYVDLFLHNYIMDLKGLTEIKTVNWGIYSGKYSVLIMVPIALGTAMGASSVPTISGLMKRGEYVDASTKIGKVIRVTMMISIPCAAGFIALAPSIMWTLFSSTNPIASNLLRIGSIGVILFSYSNLTNSILQGMGKLSKPVIHGLIALALHITILVSLLYLTDMNVYAVALSNSFFSLFICIMNLFSISRELDYRQEWMYTFVRPLICSAIMGISVFFIDKAFTVNGFSRSRTIITIILGIIIYFTLIVLSKTVTKDELTAIPGGTRIYNFLQKIKLMK